ncbi:MAG: UDP-N-acetylmuramoyl-L-alanyl-D-glutamate--2,6-diaminopimelate ligase [Holosporaceae bacterium]|jgi:UDP-N-acetylmuramoyl-L-alanyl-D-glutamate--2,6-diaminopimelate ligase|nr:UDP-N-acetylmuramoyl-L-alanyl-D-glutamate--2,6-diaminopimelate ligase [Holosporaceae bacterium]
MKKISEIVSFELPEQMRNLEVSDICNDSRKAVPKSLFVAIEGKLDSGKKYINDAIANGAKYVVLGGEKNHALLENGVMFLHVADPRAELSHLASRFFPGDLGDVVAVTGTNGKTSTVDMVRQIWAKNGYEAASLGTLGVITAGGCEKLCDNMTSPDPICLHKFLQKLSKKCVANIALEASSHGIYQRRLDNIDFRVCAFTNLSQDHLDYHGTLENYWLAKERLFSEIAGPNAVFVVNADDVYAKKIQEIAAARKIKCISYGYRSNDVKIISVAAQDDHLKIKSLFLGRELGFSLPLYGAFQAHNSLCAAIMCHVTGISVDNVVQALEQLKPIDGRLELVREINGIKIFLDYAHTPDALQNAILAVRSHTKNRVIVVFGCGGNRDQQKRQLMGEIAEQFSDLVFVTDDNPRNENPAEIRRMIMEGFRTPKGLDVSGGRRDAIEIALDAAMPGDSVLVAGKGHETHQQLAHDVIYFSDRAVILNKVFK